MPKIHLPEMQPSVGISADCADFYASLAGVPNTAIRLYTDCTYITNLPVSARFLVHVTQNQSERNKSYSSPHDWILGPSSLYTASAAVYEWCYECEFAITCTALVLRNFVCTD